MSKRPDLDSLGLDDAFKAVISQAWDRYENHGSRSETPRERAARIAAEVATKERELDGRGIPRNIAELIARNAVTGSDASRVLRGCGRKTAVLAGPVGAGKRTAAALWVADGDGRCRFRLAQDLAQLRPKWSADRARWDECLTAKALAIVDLGVESMGDDWAANLWQLVTARIDDGLRTAITTPLKAREFVERYKDKLCAKLRQNGSFYELTKRYGE